MFKLIDGDVLQVELPTGHTQEELVREAEKEIDEMAEQLYGKNLKADYYWNEFDAGSQIGSHLQNCICV